MERIKELVDFLNYHTELYDKGIPQITDKEWDDKYFELVALEKESGRSAPNSPTTSIIYNVVNELEKVKHNHLMLSLDKTKDWDEFCNYFKNKDTILMPKIDGLTVSIRYLNGKLVSAETRGNGEIGEDITHNILTCSGVPRRINYNNELIIDGEIFCDSFIFNQFFVHEYANPRNFASGSIRLLDSNECKKRMLCFNAWNVVKGFDDLQYFNERLNAIENLGIKIVPTIGLMPDADDYIINHVKGHIPIDGLVARFNDIEYGNSLGMTSHHARAAYAFKFYDEEYETSLLNIEYEPSRNGELTPVAVFEDIDTGDSIINRASLHNLSIMSSLLSRPFYMQPITVIKSNEIIPQIIRSEDGDGTHFPPPKTCPVCGEPTIIRVSDSGVKTLYCSNDKCSAKVINQFEHFCGKTGLDIKGLSKKTLGKLIEWGWLENYMDIFKLYSHRKEWINKPGFGIKSVDNILNAIEEKTKECSLESFICAIGIPLIGKTASKELSHWFLNWEDFRENIKFSFNFTQIDGFGEEMHYALHNFDYENMAIDEVGMYLYPLGAPPDNEIDTSLFDYTFVITGKLKHFKNRAELIDVIESHGGKVSGTVSSKTNYLINNDINSTTGKNAKAKQLNIPIISEEDFLTMI